MLSLRRHLLWYLLMAVMMVLLPLRGWAGTTMALGMAMQQVTAAQPGPMADMPTDCPMHASSSEGPTSEQPDRSGKACSGCDTCELCLAIASFTAPQFRAAPRTPSTAPAAVPHGFISADSAIGLKPPIS